MGIANRDYNEEGFGRSPPRLIFQMPSWLTWALIVSCVVLFLLITFTGGPASPLVEYGVLTFYHHRGFSQPWRWLTYQYLHFEGGHIFFNIISIYFLVPALEQIVGWKRTLLIYTAGGIFGGITYGLLVAVFGFSSYLIGASGAILAVLGALAALNPTGQVLAMMVFPVTWRTLAILYAILFTFLVIGNRSGADAAHLGGLAFGWVGCLFVTRYAGDLKASFERKQRQRVRDSAADEQREIDRILQKVGDQGMNSLSRGEKKTLQKATDRQRQRDVRFGQARR